MNGIMQMLNSDVGKAIAAGDAILLPATFDGVAAHGVHEVLVTELIVLVALKHQFLMKDGLMDRMSLRRKG